MFYLFYKYFYQKTPRIGRNRLSFLKKRHRDLQSPQLLPPRDKICRNFFHRGPSETPPETSPNLQPNRRSRAVKLRHLYHQNIYKHYKYP